jgi:hypothetical protein
VSEQFRFGDEAVRFSNDATAAILRAWAERGAALAETADERAVVDWLRARAGTPAGGRAFSFAPVVPELAPRPRLAFFVRLMGRLIEDLAAGPPADLDDIGWSDERRFSWLARLIDLDEWARRPLAGGGEAPPSPDLSRLSAEDRLEIEVQRRVRALDEVARRGSPAERKTQTDDLISLVEQSGPAPRLRSLLARLLQDGAELSVALGDPGGAAEALRRSAHWTDDAELREASLAYAREIEEKAK